MKYILVYFQARLESTRGELQSNGRLLVLLKNKVKMHMIVVPNTPASSDTELITSVKSLFYRLLVPMLLQLYFPNFQMFVISLSLTDLYSLSLRLASKAGGAY